MENTAADNENYYNTQFELLKHMHTASQKGSVIDVTTIFSVAELAEGTPIKDKDEALRSLYILEGQKLVTPFPPGDFTSNNWCLTEMGSEIAGKINEQTKDQASQRAA